MNMHMESQVVGMMEGFGADWAFVSFFSTMSKLMILVITVLMEALTTIFANIRLET